MKKADSLDDIATDEKLETNQAPRSRWARFASCSVVVLTWTLVWAGITLLTAGTYIRNTWGLITVDQMITNMAGAAGEGGGGLFWPTVIWVGIFPIVATVAVFILRKYVYQRLPKKYHPTRKHLQSAAQRFVIPVVGTFLVAGLAFTGSASFSSAVDLPSYVRSVYSSQNITQYYEKPVVTDSQNARNIVVVYVESAEQALTDDELFEINMLENLEDATEGWASIENFDQYEGGGWTMAGITSTQCGIPLRGKGANTGGAEMNKLDVDEFMPGVTCFGDLLKQEGYKNVYLGGSSKDFASKGNFLYSHGYDTVKDLTTWRLSGEKSVDIRPDWGLSDARLMEHAKDEVDELHAESKRTGQPFNLTVLTLDSHEPIHAYDSCDITTDDELASIWSCSAAAVAGFLDHMKKQGYMEDTSVVVMGDHLKHLASKNVYHEQLDDHPNRTIFNRIWIPGTKNGETPLGELRDIDQLSMLPTLLEIAGLEVENRQGGLGVSAFSHTIPTTSAQNLDGETYSDLLWARSSLFYDSVWSQTQEEFDRAMAEAAASASPEATEPAEPAESPEEDQSSVEEVQD